MIVGPRRLVLDAHALSSLATDGREMQAWATMARRTDSTLHASALTLAEVVDGTARDARVRLAAKAIRIHDVTPDIADDAGRLRASARGRRKARDLTVDAVVAATALTLVAPTIVLTGDPADLTLLLAGTDVAVEAVGRR